MGKGGLSAGTADDGIGSCSKEGQVCVSAADEDAAPKRPLLPAPLRIMRSFSDQSDAGEGDVFKRVRIFKSCFIYALFLKKKKEVVVNIWQL